MKQMTTFVPIVQNVDGAIHGKNLYPVDSAISLPNSYPLDGVASLFFKFMT